MRWKIRLARTTTWVRPGASVVVDAPTAVFALVLVRIEATSWVGLALPIRWLSVRPELSSLLSSGSSLG
jgi:hypothetical protein